MAECHFQYTFEEYINTTITKVMNFLKGLNASNLRILEKEILILGEMRSRKVFGR